MRRHPLFVALALGAMITVDLALGAGVGHAARNSRHQVTSLEIRTVPVGPHLRFELAGRIYTTDRTGRISVPAARVQAVTRELHTNPVALKLLPNRRHDGGFFKLQRWFVRTATPSLAYAEIDLYRPVRFSFASRTGQPISTGLIDSFQMKRIDGAVINLTGSQLQRPVMLQTSRVVPLSSKLASKKLIYRVMQVSIGGNNLVHRSQQAFRPSDTVTVNLRLLFYMARFKAHDALFGFAIGSGIRLVYPSGRVEVRRFHDDVAAASLPRGNYHVSVIGPGLSPSSPVSVTRDHLSELEVFSYLDVAVILILFLALILGLALARRRSLRRRLSPRWRRRQRRAVRRAA